MVEKPQGTDKPADTTTTATATPTAGAATVTPPRRPGHRGADVRDTVAEMAARAQEISLEAGSKIAAAMKDVIGAAAGLTGFALESARDLVQYMVRRGQMTQDEADKLIREVEDSQGTRRPTAPARPLQPRADLIRSEPTRPDSARPDSARPDSARADSDGKKHAAPASVAAPSRPAARPPSRPVAKTRSSARPAKKASRAARPKPTAAKKGAAKAKKKR